MQIPFKDYAYVDLCTQACGQQVQTAQLAMQEDRICGRCMPVALFDAGMVLSFEQGYWHTSSVDAVFLHRKLGGLYLLAARLRAKVDVRIILERYLHHE